MEVKVGQLESAVKRIGIQVDGHEDRIRALELSEMKQTMELREMITQAVAAGNEKTAKAQAESFSKLDCKLDGYMKSSEEVHNNLKDHIHELEERETKKLAEEAEQAKKDKKETRKHILRTAIAVAVTFFATLLLNNLWDYIFNVWSK